ncbi:MAG TPA: hypothetical protein VGD58_06210 [Herpetosiphonaceae bacterium]
MNITLTPDIEQALEEQAREQGTTPEQLALDSLRQQFVDPTKSKPDSTFEGSLADFLGDSIGSIDSNEHVPGGAQMSESTGKSFTQGLLKKRQQGHL